ncbi:MAG: hypothetical protein Q9218_005202 [Villophora microphyllina]
MDRFAELEACCTGKYVSADALPLLDGSLPQQRHVQQMALRLCQDIDDDNSPNEEPNPQIDYRLLHILIAMAQAELSKRDIKQFDYLAQVRKTYYRMQTKYEHFYRELQDTNAYAVILENQQKEIRESEPLDEVKLKDVERRIVMNFKEMKSQAENVKKLWQKRNEVANEFSKAKVTILKTYMPRFLIIGKEAYKNRQKPKGRIVS